ncbi:MAG: MmcQ/YjbR family DNA-binding protein [Gammaproteobacteria bacterium]|nr:MmcQ/YjbR family DNA-binding protein [Gammaproteobacteria bacterium]
MIKHLPGSIEESSYGTPGFKVRKKLFARLHQKEDAIVILLNTVREQQQLITSDPMTYYITAHYSGAAAILVRPTLAEDEFFQILQHAWRRVASKQDVETYETQSAPKWVADSRHKLRLEKSDDRTHRK